MSKSSEKIGAAVVVGAGVFAVLLLFSMIPAFVWYTMDDTTAALVGVPQLGHLSFFFVWPLCFLLSCVFKGQAATTKSE